ERERNHRNARHLRQQDGPVLRNLTRSAWAVGYDQNVLAQIANHPSQGQERAGAATGRGAAHDPDPEALPEAAQGLPGAGATREGMDRKAPPVEVRKQQDLSVPHGVDHRRPGPPDRLESGRRELPDAEAPSEETHESPPERDDRPRGRERV